MLELLEAFCRVVEEASFTRAARQLHRSQPAVTKQVARLEETLGTRLLDRRLRRITPTSEGRLVYAYAKRVTTSAADLVAAVKDIHTPDRGDVWVGCVTPLALYTLPPLLARFSRVWPDVRLHVKTGGIEETVERILSNDVDVGFVTMPAAHPEIVATPLFRDPIVLVASPRFAQTLALPLTPQDLSRIPFVAYQATSRFRAFVDSALEREGVLPQVTMEFDSHEAVITMVTLGYGAALVPLSAARATLASGSLVEVDAPGLAGLSRVTSLIVRRDAHRTPALKSFLTLTLDTLLEGTDLPPQPEGTSSLISALLPSVQDLAGPEHGGSEEPRIRGKSREG